MTIKLRVLADKLARPLPLTALREKLGGLAGACARAGELVTVEGRDGVGVLLDVDDGSAHVWLGDGRVLRTETRLLSPASDEAPPELATIARAAAAFRSLSEGDRVTFRDAGGGGEGLVADRCRFGVVVARADGSMLGVGFTRVARAVPDA